MSLLDLYRLKQEAAARRQARIDGYGQQAQQSFQQAAAFPLQMEDRERERQERLARLEQLKMQAQAAAYADKMRGLADMKRAETDATYYAGKLGNEQSRVGSQNALDTAKAGKENALTGKAKAQTGLYREQAGLAKVRTEKTRREAERIGIEITGEKKAQDYDAVKNIAAQYGRAGALKNPDPKTLVEIRRAVKKYTTEGGGSLDGADVQAIMANALGERVDHNKEKAEKSKRWWMDFTAKKEDREIRREEARSREAKADAFRQVGIDQRERGLKIQERNERRLDKSAAESIRESDVALQKISRIQDLLDKGAETGWDEGWKSKLAKLTGWGQSEINIKLASLLESLAAPIRNDTFGAALTPSDLARAELNFPDPENDKTPVTIKKIRELRDIVEKGRASYLEAESLQGRDVLPFRRDAPQRIKAAVSKWDEAKKRAFAARVKEMSPTLGTRGALIRAFQELQ